MGAAQSAKATVEQPSVYIDVVTYQLPNRREGQSNTLGHKRLQAIRCCRESLGLRSWQICENIIALEYGIEKRNTKGLSLPSLSQVSYATICRRRDYSFRELGSERFLGLFLFSNPISSCPEGGTATAPLRTMLSASIFFP